MGKSSSGKFNDTDQNLRKSFSPSSPNHTHSPVTTSPQNKGKLAERRSVFEQMRENSKKTLDE